MRTRNKLLCYLLAFLPVVYCVLAMVETATKALAR